MKRVTAYAAMIAAMILPALGYGTTAALAWESGVRVSVKAGDLDISDPKDAHELYIRLARGLIMSDPKPDRREIPGA